MSFISSECLLEQGRVCIGVYAGDPSQNSVIGLSSKIRQEDSRSVLCELKSLCSALQDVRRLVMGQDIVD